MLCGCCVWLLCVVVGNVVAQEDFRPGYLIRINGDTLCGMIDYRNDNLMNERCVFKLDGQQEATVYYPADILAYRFIDSKYFVLKKIKTSSVFLECLIAGKLNLYVKKRGLEDLFYIETDVEPLIEVPYEEGLRVKNDTSYYYKSTKHIGILQVYMKDAPELQGEITRMTMPRKKTLMSLAERYHSITCDGEKCIVYEKKKSALRSSTQLVAGVTHFFSSINSVLDKPVREYVPAYGILAHIGLPALSENIYLRTGYVHAGGSSDEKVWLQHKIPLQIEYLYPTGVLRPRFSAGYDFLLYLPSVSLGVNVSVAKHVWFTVDCDMNFWMYKNKILLPDRVLSSSLYAGVRFDL